MEHRQGTKDLCCLFLGFSSFFFLPFYVLRWWDSQSKIFNSLLMLFLIWEYVHLDAHTVVGIEN